MRAARAPFETVCSLPFGPHLLPSSKLGLTFCAMRPLSPLLNCRSLSFAVALFQTSDGQPQRRVQRIRNNSFMRCSRKRTTLTSTSDAARELSSCREFGNNFTHGRVVHAKKLKSATLAISDLTLLSGADRFASFSFVVHCGRRCLIHRTIGFLTMFSTTDINAVDADSSAKKR